MKSLLSQTTKNKLSIFILIVNVILLMIIAAQGNNYALASDSDSLENQALQEEQGQFESEIEQANNDADNSGNNNQEQEDIDASSESQLADEPDQSLDNNYQTINQDNNEQANKQNETASQEDISISDEDKSNNEDKPKTKIIYGCTDPKALNYDPQANKDDNTCHYQPLVPFGTNKEDQELLKSYFSNSDNSKNNREESQERNKPSQRIDSATAPSQVSITVLMPDGNPPNFPVFVTFVGVGGNNYGGKIDANGQIKVIMPTGRYYTELMVVNTDYIPDGDGPSFFLEANEQRDLGVIKLKLKGESENQSITDRALEKDINQALEKDSVKGLAKILVLIIKLLMQILEQVRSISSQLAGK